jgi:hypothetical protein
MSDSARPSSVKRDSLVPAVPEVVHDDAESHGLIWLAKQGLVVVRNQSYVIEQSIERVKKDRIRERLLVVIDKPACRVIVQVCWVAVKEALCTTAMSARHNPSTWKQRATHRIHTCDERKVGARVIPGGQKKAAPLGSRQINHASLRLMGVDAINLDYSHVVPFEPHILAGKGTDVDHTHEVRLARLQCERQIMGVVEQGRLRDRFSSARVLLAHKARDQTRHLVVIPIGYGKDDLFVVLVLVRIVGVMDDEGPSQTIGVLPLIMGMIPICSRLVNLSLL